MKTQQINNFNFGNKSTFLQKSKNALSLNEERYFKSFHYEAKSRAHNIKFISAKKELQNTDNPFSFSALKTFGKMVKEKITSNFYKFKSYDELPKIFYEPEAKEQKVKKHITYTKL